MNETESLYVGKLSVKGIGCKPGACEEGKPAILCRIFGKADGIKVGESKDGRVWQALTGTFVGLNMQDGKEYRSGKLFLPSGIHETVENAVKALGTNEAGLSIKFALEIRSVVASNPIGYSYQAANLIQVESTDELSELRKAIEAARPMQLAAPARAVEMKNKPVEAEKPKSTKKGR